MRLLEYPYPSCHNLGLRLQLPSLPPSIHPHVGPTTVEAIPIVAITSSIPRIHSVSLHPHPSTHHLPQLKIVQLSLFPSLPPFSSLLLPSPHLTNPPFFFLFFFPSFALDFWVPRDLSPSLPDYADRADADAEVGVVDDEEDDDDGDDAG